MNAWSTMARPPGLAGSELAGRRERDLGTGNERNATECRQAKQTSLAGEINEASTAGRRAAFGTWDLEPPKGECVGDKRTRASTHCTRTAKLQSRAGTRNFTPSDSSDEPAMIEQLILVNENNRAVGRAEKRAVHVAGLLHRAFSIFLVNDDGELLLQRRSRRKYHSAGLWANSCCGHPRPGEATLQAAHRRLGEELGATASLRYAFRARYCTALPNGLVENELVYVFFGHATSGFALNPDEASGVRWMTLASLQRDIARHPRRYAYWLRYYMKNHYGAIRRAVKAA
jgi:isopentenyl-diphosphate delta-isomerase